MGNMFEGKVRQQPAPINESFNRRRGGGGQQRGGGKVYNKPEGLYSTWFPKEKSCWINVAPTSYKYEIWDKESREVVEVHTTYLETRNHYVPRTRRGFTCSAGAHRNKPCYGCGVQNKHYEYLDQVESETGVRPDTKAPIGGGPRFSFAITVMEEILKLPALDDRGTPKRNKKGETYSFNVPAPYASIEERKTCKTKEWGMRAHFSMSSVQAAQLIDVAGAKLNHYCVACAQPMSSSYLTCPDCETSLEIERSSASDLADFLCEDINCEGCGSVTRFVVHPEHYECACGNPTAGGSLLTFDLRVRRKKTSDTSSIIEIESVRVPLHLDSKTPKAVKERLETLVAEPLDLKAIFAPADLDYQRFLIGSELLAGVTPEPRRNKAPATEAYDETVNWNDDQQDA